MNIEERKELYEQLVAMADRVMAGHTIPFERGQRIGAMSGERLQPGMWCRPSSERWWRAVLELSDALGLGGVDFVETAHKRHSYVWWDEYNGISCVRPCGHGGQLDKCLPVSEFISRMYAEAEARKAPESGFGAFAPKPGEIGFLKEFIDKLDGMAVRLSMINDKVNHIRLRLEALEEALGEHLCKHRASGL